MENAAECQKVIQANLMHTKLQGRARLLQTDVLFALDRLAAEGKKFDIIFMDPPYEAGLYTSSTGKNCGKWFVKGGGVSHCRRLLADCAHNSEGYENFA